jgi:AcrR family transcriptional regulator
MSAMYGPGVPKLWRETIEEHRRSVDEAILDTTWGLVTERGLLAVTMSEIAEKTGIGRATLYKHFPDVEAILSAHHRRHVSGHLAHLTQLRSRPGDPGERLRAVLGAYALISHHRGRHGTEELGALLHRGDDVRHAEQELLQLFRELVVEAVDAGQLRHDVSADEMATYCLHSLGAAKSLPSEAAVHRLVSLTLAGLAPDAAAVD